MTSKYNDKRILNVSQAAEYSGYSRSTIISWIINGLLPYESPPGLGDGKYRTRKIRKDDLDRFLNKYYGCHKGAKSVQSTQQYVTKVTLAPRS